MRKNRTERFWRWLRKHAEQRILDHVGGCQCRCPRCETWTPLMDGPHIGSWWERGSGFGYLNCGKCGWQSKWRTDSVLPILDDGEELRAVPRRQGQGNGGGEG